MSPNSASTQKRRFEELTPCEVLALAIHIERANTRRFRTFAGVFDGYDAAVSQHFEEMAQEEEQHEAMLLAQFWKRFGETIPNIDEADVDAVIESVDLDDGEHQIFDSLRPRQVFELALQAEHHAQTFYERATERCADPQLAKLYRELATMEDGHVSFLQQRLDQLDGEDKVS